MNGHERRVAERGGLAGLAHEPGRELAILREPAVQDLHRDLALQDRMHRGVHRRDAADADHRPDDVLAGERLTGALLGTRNGVGVARAAQLTIGHCGRA
jgi:hypothetical protein